MRNSFAEQATGPLATIADHLPVPEPYRVGVRFRIFDDANLRKGYLFGELYRGGKLAFYPALLVIKTPLGILALWAVGIWALVTSRRRAELVAYILVPPLFLLLLAMMSHINIGVRHVITIPFFMAVASGGLVRLRTRAKRILAVVCLAAAALSVWHVYPSYLAYANEAFGGPARLERLASDSNVDWGQDLRRLSDWLRRNHPGERTALLYFGTTPIDAYGFNSSNSWNLRTELPAHVDGLVAISVTSYAYIPALHPYLRSIGVEGTPIARIGYSIDVYRGR